MDLDRPDLEARFGRVILPLARRWRAEADRTLSALGLSHASGWVLLHVGRLGDAVRQSDLAAALDMRGPSLVRLIDLLEADRLIARQVEQGDRRINRIHLTKAGHALVEQIELALRAVRKDMLGDIDPEALEIATTVLETVADRLIDRREQRR